jgi:hypothetical protein
LINISSVAVLIIIGIHGRALGAVQCCGSEIIFSGSYLDLNFGSGLLMKKYIRNSDNLNIAKSHIVKKNSFELQII